MSRIAYVPVALVAGLEAAGRWRYVRTRLVRIGDVERMRALMVRVDAEASP